MRTTIAIVILLASAFFLACNKDDNNGNGSRVEIRMTDNPVLADEVNIDLQRVSVQFSDDSVNDWIDLDTHAGVYNLLGLQNGVDTLIAAGVIPTRTLREIRLVLGSNNTIKVNGVVYELQTPSAEQSGLKIKVNKNLNGTLDSLLIDFDAALSIHQTGNGTYILQPVLKIK